MVAVWNFGATCTDFSGGALNSEFSHDSKSRQLKLLNTDRADKLGCPAASCCLQAEPCVAPCTLPAGFGWIFITVLVIGCCLYVSIGVSHSVKVRGVPLSAEVGQLLPHTEHWLALVGLVKDGMLFSKARYEAYRSGGVQAGVEGLLAPHAPEVPKAGASRGGEGSDDGSDGSLPE